MGALLRNALVGSGWATAKKIVLSPCTAPISGGEAFIPVWASGCRLSAMTIAYLLMGGCSLSHKHVDYGCESTCVKFVG